MVWPDKLNDFLSLDFRKWLLCNLFSIVLPGVESIPIMNKSLRLVSEFRTTASSRLLVDTKQQQHRCSLVQWRLPARDWLKVNIYASRCSVSGYATSGGVVRDSGGT
ncbi:hypothetical protein V6N11_063290 [Hibiscus sabdariffa]|uniref:Uncharacterized protein n=1 Tax=Hibiscus sabdariffa TaxID=183260 RepID=A0ABR2NGQ1_9ROSI